MRAERGPQPILRRAGTLGACLLAIIAAVWSPGHAGAQPSLTLTPDRGPCTSRIAIHGAGLLPGQSLALSARASAPGSSDLVLQFATPTSGADGTIAIEADIARALPGCQTGPPPAAGTTYTIFLGSNERPGQNRLLATATFTLTTTPVGATMPGLPNTGGGGTKRQTLASAIALVGVAAVAIGGASRFAHRRRRS